MRGWIREFKMPKFREKYDEFNGTSGDAYGRPAIL